jgi:hypothetical protein
MILKVLTDASYLSRPKPSRPTRHASPSFARSSLNLNPNTPAFTPPLGLRTTNQRSEIIKQVMKRGHELS